IEERRLMDNATEVGAYLRERLLALKEKYPVVGDVRGMGLLQAVELVEDRRSKTPATQLTLAVLESARDQRILIGRGGLNGNVIRLSPPLNIAKSDVDEFAGRLDASLAKAVAQLHAAVGA
ncbi:MAG TPA: aminotransferase class III-fold pyridoxal phosphate-dependent enzyme, partial [Bryobacteraceae bacterium]|nr:aminotransferase class III-fold pyridoxal phosphate-dependent enzyme [Bryobacteraceae bacterium]